MTSKEKAEELFKSFYMILFDSDSDKGEEILVSLLAQKCAMLSLDQMENILIEYGREHDDLQNMDGEWRWLDKVRTELNKM